MASKGNREVFINIAVRDLQKSMAFFAALGFEFNKQFTDEKAACMILSDKGYVMLLSDPFFQGFTKRQPADTTKTTEVIIALACESRAEVEELLRKALDAGGTQAMDPMDHGFMYNCSFYDLDGHHWEILWMDPSTVQ